MRHVTKWGVLIFSAVLLALQAIYVAGFKMYTLWFLALVLASGITAIKTKHARRGLFTGLILWFLALIIYEVTLVWLQWNMSLHTFEWKSFYEGLVLIICFGIPISWTSSWLSLKSKVAYIVAVTLSTIGISAFSKVLLSLVASGQFGRWM